MTRQTLILLGIFLLCLTPGLVGQVTLNPNPARVLGHPQLALKTANPNLVEGRELYNPRAVAVDTTATPPIVYVADMQNNRVLGWRNAPQSGNGAAADIVIGQKDMYTTFPQGTISGAELNGGLNLPTGLAVDAQGNLFVADSGNNRILRYPRPFDNPTPSIPDLVIGQTTLGTRTSNNDPDTHTISARTLALSTGSILAVAPLLFDSAGNLFIADAGNHRVLRYPAALIGPGASNGPAADLVLGQATFVSLPPQNPTNISDLTKLYSPGGMAIDSEGRLYVCDVAHRVLVYSQMSSGAAADRMIGGLVTTQGLALQPPTSQSLNTPEAIFLVNDAPYVLDSGNHRILAFRPYALWPPDVRTPPTAVDLIGQASYEDYKPNRGAALPVTGAPLNVRVSFYEPAFAVRAAAELFVADALNHRVAVLPDPATTSGINMSAQRVLGQQWFDSNAPNLVEGREFYFGNAGGVAVDTHSSPPRLYVADTYNNRVLGFKDARVVRPGDAADLVIGQPDLVRTVANYPSGKADQPTSKSLFQPTGLVVDGSGNLYVADTSNGRVLRFPSPFDGGNNPAADLVLGEPGFTSALDPAADPTAAHMSAPYGLAFAVAGHLVVSDLYFNRVLLFQKPSGGDFTTGMAARAVIGQPDFTTKTAGSANNKMSQPHHIGIDTNDRLFVCDTGNNRVQAYESVGNIVGPGPSPAFILTRADPVGSLSAPQGIYVSPVTGEIWVANTGNQYILRYPEFSSLIVNPLPDFVISSGANIEHPLALTVDGFSNLLVAFSTNRLGFYFPAATAMNGANLLTRLTPGMISYLYPMGFNFGSQNVSATTLPLPTELADTQVLVNNQPVPLLMVSPSQINFIWPMNAPTSGSVEVQVVKKSLGQILAVGCSAEKYAVNPDKYRCTGSLQMDLASPGLFAGAGPAWSSVKGQLAAVNVRASDGTYYGVNSATNPVARSDYVEIYGTGQGYIPNPPADGVAPGYQPLYWTPGPKPQVIVNVARVPDEFVTFSGLSPSYPGLWQLDVKIPDSTPPGNAIQVVVVHKGIPSNDPQNPGKIVTTIAVKQ